jgi:hypothetical protein
LLTGRWRPANLYGEMTAIVRNRLLLASGTLVNRAVKEKGP